jgi:hypothetical protein
MRNNGHTQQIERDQKQFGEGEFVGRLTAENGAENKDKQGRRRGD